MSESGPYVATREIIETNEASVLASYAALSARSRGRQYPEPEHPYRTCYQRDRDRVIHSAAFRRLKHKTQVFAAPGDDHFRTRLTHTMEVAQISRTVARALRLNEDLAETIALVHDLGHTPFGHSGEEALRKIFRSEGGFNHNAQSLRVVDYLEDRYPGFQGLNLTYEVREGIVKHETDYDMPISANFSPELRPSLESQIVNYADEIAYNAHDVDDGVFSGKITAEQIKQIPIVARLICDSESLHKSLTERKRHYHLIRLLINWAVSDLITTSAQRLREFSIESYEDVTHHHENIITFSPDALTSNRELKAFLFEYLYRHPDLAETNRIVEQVVSELFQAYISDPKLMNENFRRRVADEPMRIVVKDYIAGMTDRFALQEHSRIVGTVNPYHFHS